MQRATCEMRRVARDVVLQGFGKGNMGPGGIKGISEISLCFKASHTLKSTYIKTYHTLKITDHHHFHHYHHNHHHHHHHHHHDFIPFLYSSAFLGRHRCNAICAGDVFFPPHSQYLDSHPSPALRLPQVGAFKPLAEGIYKPQTPIKSKTSKFELISAFEADFRLLQNQKSLVLRKQKHNTFLRHREFISQKVF
jgi:hypothetical protein